ECAPDGTILLRLRRRWRDGTWAVRFRPTELLEKLAAMIPKPRINLLVYHGEFAPHARGRAETVRGARARSARGRGWEPAGEAARGRRSCPGIACGAGATAAARARCAVCAAVALPMGRPAPADLRDRCARMPRMWRPPAAAGDDRASADDCRDLAPLGPAG